MNESTLPSGNYKPTKKLPSTFSRPSIEIGGGKAQKKREWHHVTALDVKTGDIIADLGLVHDLEYKWWDEPATGEKVIMVRMNVGDHGWLAFDSTTSMKAFI